MTGLVMMPRVVPVGRSVDDTIAACGSVSKAYRYCHGAAKPNFPVPAPIAMCTHHLNLIAAEPMQAWEDFKALGWHGGW